MKITRDEVLYVAHLARLELTEAEVERFTVQLNDILLYMDKLNELDTEGIAPMSHALVRENAWREDVVHPSLPPEVALANAPDPHSTFFRVPKVIE